jgi:hypothetical protein
VRAKANVLLGIALALVLALPAWADAQAGAPAEAPSITLTALTPWVGPGGELTIGLRVDRATRPQDLEIAVSVYEAVGSRSEFAQALHDRISSPAITTQVSSLASLSPDPAGQLTVPVRVQDPSLPRDAARVALGRDDGVFPVRVDLRERGTSRVVDRFVTDLVYLPNPHTGPKLGVALIVRIHTPVNASANGDRAPSDVDALTSLVQGLDAVRGAPVALVPTPETLAALAASNDDRAAALLSSLKRVSAEHTTLNTSFVPVNLPALRAAGLDRDASTQITRGPTVAADVLGAHADPRTWLVDAGLDPASLSDLAGRGVDRIVATEDAVEPIPDLKLTLTQPFRIGNKQKASPSSGSPPQPMALAADPGLAAHLTDPVSPVLAANQMLADLAMLYFDHPGGDRRGVVALAPLDWKPNRQFLETFVAGLNQNPIVEAASLDNLFTSVAPARGDNGGPLVRALANKPSPGLADVAADLRSARKRLDGLGSILGNKTSSTVQLDDRLLKTESSELTGARPRQAMVDSVQHAIDSQLSHIQMPQGRSITLTSRRAEIPVTFQNRIGSPARVVVRIQSDKLAFPRGTIQTLDLVRLNTTQRFSVESKTSGAFPLRITLESPDGNLVIGRARLTVRSTAASSVSLVVSLGAALFLAVWWGRHALHNRRDQRVEAS